MHSNKINHTGNMQHITPKKEDTDHGHCSCNEETKRIHHFIKGQALVSYKKFPITRHAAVNLEKFAKGGTRTVGLDLSDTGGDINLIDMTVKERIKVMNDGQGKYNILTSAGSSVQDRLKGRL